MIRRRRRVVLAGLLVAATGVSAGQQFRARVDLVHLPVILTGKGGVPVRGLQAADFEVFEDGRQQPIQFFAEGAPGEALPLHLGLVLDASGSMELDLRDATRAAVQFVRTLDDTADVTFVDFDTRVRLGRFSPDSYPQLFERIRATKIGGLTSLYDAVGVYLESALGRPGQHVLVLYTDGGDTTSRMSFDTLQRLLRVGNVIVYAVGYLEHQLGSVRLTQQMRVTQIARETGGEAFFPGSPGQLDKIYTQIRDELAGRYTLGYVPPAGSQDGKFRKIEVRLTRPDLKGAKLRTRSGYLVPSRPPSREAP